MTEQIINWEVFKNKWSESKDSNEKRTILQTYFFDYLVEHGYNNHVQGITEDIKSIIQKMDINKLNELMPRIFENKNIQHIIDQMISADNELFQFLDSHKNEIQMTENMKQLIKNLMKLQFNAFLRMLKDEAAKPETSHEIVQFNDNLIKLINDKIEKVNKLQETDLISRYSGQDGGNLNQMYKRKYLKYKNKYMNEKRKYQ